MIRPKIKTCRTCAQCLPADCFEHQRRICKPCRRTARNAVRSSLRDRDKERRYYTSNREAHIDRAKARYRENRALIIEQTRLRERAYRKENPAFIIARRIGKRLAKVLNGKRPKGWQEQIGYDPALLVPHLEAQFEPWMTWDNYGTEWHIDHRRPVSSFDLPAQIKECWALSNLQPLKAIDNLRKGASWQAAA
ncbi:hypothetical protein [Bradyrhizobium lablabi]|uniref:hypothetical protein n=1 Tax=Bradyrhizobium lablabi TaxID=722472 RepID=UPI001BA5316D|nr:hypothetical protein [Bradyrhizobium lablabi]MBR0693700.1 hypothetical protein [Bradyrhizobium lablabi]